MSELDITMVSDDAWQRFTPENGQNTPPADGAWLVPVETWLAHREELLERPSPVGLWVKPGDDVDALSGTLDGLALVAVDFPVFTDGRSFTAGKLIRQRLGWTGELRAIGDVLADLVNYLARCGFDSFALKPGQSLESAQAQLRLFARGYQRGYAHPLASGGNRSEIGQPVRSIRFIQANVEVKEEA